MGTDDPNLQLVGGHYSRKVEQFCADCDMPLHRNNWADHLRSKKHKFSQLTKAIYAGGIATKPPEGVKVTEGHVWCPVCEQEVGLSLKDNLQLWREHVLGIRHSQMKMRKAIASIGGGESASCPGQKQAPMKRPLGGASLSAREAYDAALAAARSAETLMASRAAGARRGLKVDPGRPPLPPPKRR